MQGWGCNIVQHGSACVCTRLVEEQWPSVEIILRRPEGNGYDADSDDVGHVNDWRMEWENI